MIVLPIIGYVVWSIIYSTLNFKLAKERIKRKGRQNLYQYFLSMSSVQNFLKNRDLSLSPLGFMCSHFLFWFACHIVSILQYHIFWLNSLFVAYYSILSIWNGACFYMEYFSKKYELQLNELDRMQKTAEKDE